MTHNRFPEKQGLYDPSYEHDSCGVGFVCNIKGIRSNELVHKSLEVLKRLSHRGAVGADPKTGDGAGILIQMPHELFFKICDREKIRLSYPGNYASGLLFLPQEQKEREYCKQVFNSLVAKNSLVVSGWRKVDVNDSVIGKTARDTQPVIEQPFISPIGAMEGLSFERRLYVLRKQIEKAIRNSKLKQKSYFYITNLSSRTFSYKGLLMPNQLESFFPDLSDPDLKSAIVVVHSRYSTNTFPTWDLAQPFRYLAHNGEINTLRGNINWMKAKERLLESPFFKNDIESLKPVVVEGGSDSAGLDNVCELLALSGRSLAHSMAMLVPCAWEQNRLLDKKVRAFYEYHACIMEPWDGPASIAFTDGTNIGALLDRNGLRPARYIITKDANVVMASEVGVLDLKPDEIEYSGRLEPGKILFVNTQEGRLVTDEEIKESLALRRPYLKWVRNGLTELRQIRPAKGEKPVSEITRSLKAFGYSREDLKVIIKPMAETGYEPTGSMGNDTPLAVLSQEPRLLYDYFKQLFAQVTNPAIDPIREELIMSLDCYMGGRLNILNETADHCRRIHIKAPILNNAELAKIKNINERGFKSKTVSLLFSLREDGVKNFKQRLDEICIEAEQAIEKKAKFIILSDRGFGPERAALPALLAVGAVHQYLIKKAKRSQIALILESAEPREVHHFALLLGFGAGCVNPYLAFESIERLIRENELSLSGQKAKANYIKALNKGILKILSKMGISTLQSYRGAQIFEALGLADDVIEKCFKGTSSRIGGADLDIIARETLLRFENAYQDHLNVHLLSGGRYQYKRDGCFHLWNPESIASLQQSCRNNDWSRYREFTALINDQSEQPVTLRSLLKFKETRPININEVESETEIFKRFATGAMSFGSISRQAHESLALAMNELGAKSNTGEGGEDPERFKIKWGKGSKSSAIKQIASGRFGVTINYLANAKELQIKICQGAKPGEGGQLPGHKVSEIIARTRCTTAGVTLISPPPHHDIYSIEDLAQLIFDLKNANPQARISVKLVSEIGVGTIAAGVAKGHADMILISGGDGGTGASPLSSIMHAGLPWELGLSETHQTLVLNNLRTRVRLQTDGQMRTGRDVAIAAILGAEEFGFCTAALIVLGCCMLRHCHLNSCSLGIATQDQILEKRFKGNPEHLINYFTFVARDLREIMASLGVRKIDELVGRPELLELNRDIIPWKANFIDYSKILYKPKVTGDKICKQSQDHGIDAVLDKMLIKKAKTALEGKGKVEESDITIRNSDRTTGAMLSNEIAKRFGQEGLEHESISFGFKGFAGQSFGAFLAKGVTFKLYGMANDYVGKGISGGKIIICPQSLKGFSAQRNIIIGNTCFYGAIQGEAYISGLAGERFCIRNSGLNAVVEGVGDHGCEYMTGGRVLILGQTGRNFAAGMSGGIAYVFDPEKKFEQKCNMDMVKLEALQKVDEEAILSLLENHFEYTQSRLAADMLKNFNRQKKYFVKVMPFEYKRVLEHQKERIDIEAREQVVETSEG